MASAELLNITHSVNDTAKRVEGKVQDVYGNVHDLDNKVQGVDDSMRGIGSDVKDISSGVRGVDDKLDQVNRSYRFITCSWNRFEDSDSFTGNQLKDSLLRWLSPPEPSINHNIACKAHHDGTAQWFLQGSTFKQWKSTDPFLWIRGKRALLLAFMM
jgi:hypothetical protein